MSPRAWVAAAIATGLLVVACTDTYLFDERLRDSLPVDRTLTLQGRFCTLGTNAVVRPIKLAFALDASQSMKVTDPDGTRARALIELFETLPQDPEIYVSVLLFAGSTSAYLTNNNQAGFVPLISLTPDDRLRLNDQLLNFTNPSTDPNRDSTDFVKPLADLYAMVNGDIAAGRANAQAPSSSGDAGAESLARYSVVFLSDGAPTVNQDDELLRGDAVVRIRQLKDLAEDVRVNTVHVFNPLQPVSTVCDLTPGSTVGCPLLLVNQDAERLQEMARLGGGDFRDFRNNEPINFLNFQFGTTRRAFDVKELVASNFSAPAGSPQDKADTDGDGLADDAELQAGTDPWKADTDGDGFSDGVEVRFRALGGNFTPDQRALPDGGGLDPGCPNELRGVDSDCDGLNDCDEQLAGTNSTKLDTDDDGIPDDIEWLMGTQGASQDLDEDPDSDGVPTRDELRRHTDPKISDSSEVAARSYRYTIEKDGPVDPLGSQCYKFKVENVLLADTEPDLRDVTDGGTGTLAGVNDLFLSLSMIPADNPTAPTIVRTYRYRKARYPVGGIKLPVDGVVPVRPEDFVDRCAPRP